MSVDIVGIGICTVDHLLKVPNFPVSGRNTYANEYLHQGGGLVATALVAAQRLGAETRVIARVGDDEDGRFVRNGLEAEGVDTSTLQLSPDATTHISMVLVEETSGERSFVGRWAVNATITPDDFTQDDITSARMLFIDNVTDGTLQAAQWAREAGMTVVMDPAASCQMPCTQQILPWVDVPIVPEVFAQNWKPDQPASATALGLVDMGARIAVVTLGARGCVVATRDGVQNFPAFPIKVVDTTGAGDAFHGAFMYGLLQGWDIPEIARFASAVGALNCQQLGGRTGLPTRQQVEAFLAAHA